jgi:hypothetical protein
LKPLSLGFDARGHPILLDTEGRKSHAHVIGSSGSGKSKFLEHLIRNDLDNRQGFALLDPHGTLYHDVVSYCARHVLDREVILLDLSQPDTIVGFNPFQRAPTGDVSVQVDARIEATMHAWGVGNTDQTPTLTRTLRLIYTVMIEKDLGLPQVRHLIDFNAREIRSNLVEQLDSPLIQSEWRELQLLKARDWRDETLSAKNRLFKLLNSTTLARFMGVPGHSINLQEVMDEGKVLLVNLAPSDHLSNENARAFGALLVNEFFEHARRRKKDDLGHDPNPFYLYLDEFQNFVSLDIASMLDQVRKFGLFLVLAHQRFGQLDQNIIDAALTNCQIRAVFGGLPVPNARRMAEELFIGNLDPMKVKAAIYQTKFWPQYSRDKVYTRGSGHTTSTARSSSVGGGESSTTSSSSDNSAAYFYDDWFSLPQLSGTRTETSSSRRASMSGSSSSWAESSTDGQSHSDSQSVADVPIFIPVPFEELSSVQYFSFDEQLTQLTAALKEQFKRHCFIKLHQEETQPMLVPFVERVNTFDYSRENLDWYVQRELCKQQALPAEEVDRLLAQQETALLQAADPELFTHNSGTDLLSGDLWTRTPMHEQFSTASASSKPQKVVRKPGPPADTDNHLKAARIVSSYGEAWDTEGNLYCVCQALDDAGVPVPTRWWMRKDVKAQTWTTALRNNSRAVKTAIRDRLRAASKARTDEKV